MSLFIQESVSLKAKTTMKIGGTARYFATVQTREGIKNAVELAREKALPLVVLGGGSNTIFDDADIHAVVVQVKHDACSVDGDRVTVGAGAYLATVVNTLAEQELDLSALAGIPGSVGGAIFGNAGQGPKGVWMDSFLESVTFFSQGEWKTLSKDECCFRYRESLFKDLLCTEHEPPILFEATLCIPRSEPAAIKAQIESLLRKRIETQPHLKTAGSCFKAVGSTPAWQLIDSAGLRGMAIGGVEISPKHANFLINTGTGTFQDAKEIVELVQQKISEPLEVEMRFIGSDGKNVE
jgi:UDP-N-acetylmuramate dehydrogenase